MSANSNSGGAEAAEKAVREAVEGALLAGGWGVGDLRALCLSLSGVDCEADAERWEALARGWFPGVRVRCCNDAVAALAAGTGGDLRGAALVAGTGTVALGFAEPGEGTGGSGDGGAAAGSPAAPFDFGGREWRSARAAGWGGVFLDGGSGFDLGQRALASAARALDGRDPERRGERLAAAVLEAVGARDAEGLLAWAYDPAGGGGAGAWAPIAALAPVVDQLAAEGDEAALDIMGTAGAELYTSLHSVIRRLGLGADGRAFPVVLAGGLMRKGGALGTAVVRHLAEACPLAEAVFPDAEPAQGAALLARQLLRISDED